jgi:hypothetical protein
MNSQSLQLPAQKTGASGRYKLQVVEHPILAVLRRFAGYSAGLPEDYDGSVGSYLALTQKEKDEHDVFLKELVKENRGTLDSNRDQRVLVGSPIEGHNLILDQGLNNIMTSYAWCNAFTACAVGTGTTPTFTDSGAVTATASGTTVTSSGAIFTAPMTGQLINFNTGEQRYLTFVDATHATLSSSLTVGSPTLFTVYAVNQTGLDTEVKRSNSYLTGSGNCGTSNTSSSQSMMRTYDFSAEGSNINYSELGWSNTVSSGANLFSRALVSGGTVTVLTGQSLRVVYTLTVTVPSTNASGSYTITGWPVAPSTLLTGNYNLGNPFGTSVLGTVNTSGGSAINSAAAYDIGDGSFAGSSGATLVLGTGSTLPTFGSNYSAGTIATSASISVGSYSSGTFQRDYIYHFGVSNGNRTDFRGLQLTAAGTTVFIFVFDEDQTKDNLHTLDVHVTIAVQRVLVNP